ncbi:structural maintenance of chromosomes protein 5 [Vanessa atalanta]|uniref:structural maintenance of chromosomes protein 5 n=1 Tax=Vanessa atalanta TaxID=42275 RepID=UPI001FCD77E6|nr:structural maintenance of chromosomes protein 5 [Vanessa atalanta]
MSAVVNNNDVTPGCIYRIYLQNFVTYKEVELYPGTSLNLIIGPNGTGKSTFLNAIILGLCGKTSIIGRAEKVADYIRTNCETATIELELYQERGKKNVIIKRTINLQDMSTWSIDNVAVSEKQVQELIEKFNIQVDNLCQLLPQDKVHDFSNLNPKELLKSTLSAVKGEDSVKKLDKLIETSLEQENLKKSVNQTVTQLSNLKSDNERLRAKVEVMKKRNEFEDKIQICERKKMWLESRELKEQVSHHESENKKAIAELKRCENKLKPIQNSLENDKRSITVMEQQKLATVREIENLKELIKKTIETLQSEEHVIRDAQLLYQENIERQSNKEHELSEAKAKLEMLINNKQTLESRMGMESDLQAELQQLKQSIGKTTATYDIAKKKKQQIEYELLHTIESQIKSCTKRLNTLRDVNNERLRTLERYHKDTYKAVEWLRENGHLFKHPVYEPMMLLINFTEPKFARYLEATVPMRDLVAFTFECKDDMNRFLLATRRELGLRAVNAVCSRAAPPPAPRAPPPAHLGFRCYLAQALRAPPALLRYLCAGYGLHRIPVGDRHTYENAHRVPPHITCFFTENHKFTVRTSAYSREVSSSTFELRPARLLANTLDVDQINALEAELVKLEKLKKEKESQLSNVQSQLTTLEAQEKEINTAKIDIDNIIGKMVNLSALIRLQERKTNDIANERAVNTDHERALCKAKQKEAVLKQCRLHDELLKIFKKLHQTVLKRKLITIRLEKTRGNINEYKSKLRKSEGELTENKELVESKERQIKQLNLKINEILTKLKSICNNKLPNDRDFPYTEQFKALPSKLSQLQEHRSELETRMNAINPGDAQAIKEYEAKEREIAKLENLETNSNNQIIKLQNKINQMKRQWLTDVEELVNNININFREMFRRVDCAGEVKLEKGEKEDDFGAYGIGIWVKFREREEMMQLSRHTQSGGERALTTALYLLALQSLVAVPFRCVDEINQGMDTVNERKMIQLLVRETTDLQNSQYFMLTPKLLPNLEYNEHIMVHTIMNGKEIMNYKDWNYSSFLKKARSNRLLTK